MRTRGTFILQKIFFIDCDQGDCSAFRISFKPFHEMNALERYIASFSTVLLYFCFSACVDAPLDVFFFFFFFFFCTFHSFFLLFPLEQMIMRLSSLTSVTFFDHAHRGQELGMPSLGYLIWG